MGGGCGKSAAQAERLTAELERRAERWDASVGKLNLRGMKLTSWPDAQIARAGPARIKILDLRENLLVEIPCAVGVGLGAMVQLESLLLDGNPLTKLPPEVRAKDNAGMLEHFRTVAQLPPLPVKPAPAPRVLPVEDAPSQPAVPVLNGASHAQPAASHAAAESAAASAPAMAEGGAGGAAEPGGDAADGAAAGALPSAAAVAVEEISDVEAPPS